MKIQIITKYRKNFPAIMSKKPHIKGSLNQPAAKQKASPIRGNHENNNTQTPLDFTVLSAFWFLTVNMLCRGYFFAANEPKYQVVIAPKVLPRVATVNNAVISCVFLAAI